MSSPDRQEHEILASSGIDRTAGYLLAGLGLLLFVGVLLLALSQLDFGPVRLDAPVGEQPTAAPTEIGGLPQPGP